MMFRFTTESSHRIFLTVLHLLLLLGVIGNCSPETLLPTKTLSASLKSPQENANKNDKNRESEEEQPLFKSILYSSPNSFFDDVVHDHGHDLDLRSRNYNPPSSVMIKANLPFTTTAHDKSKPNSSNNYRKGSSPDFGRRQGLPTTSTPPYASNGNFFDCFFGKNCLVEDDGKDEWRNYYSVLNGLDKPGFSERYMHKLPFGGGGGSNEFQTGISASIPFIVEAGNNHKNKMKDEDDAGYNRRGDYGSTYRKHTPPTPPHIRLSRTSTSSPNWVKLQPLPSHMYDPFPKNKSSGAANIKSNSESGRPSQFASRIGGAGGDEMSPEAFADRYGWTKDSQQNLRIPSWLEELNYQHGVRNPGSGEGQRNPSYGGGGDRFSGGPPAGAAPDDNKGWVKLDPIPVSGVTISKWVPKGTSPAELPSTNWPVRDKPNAWWDRIDVGPPPSRPESSWSDGPIRSPLLASSAGSSASWGAHRYPLNHNHNKKHQHGQTLSDAWSDVIYPDTPTSATASWEATKGVSSSASSFPSSWLSNGNSGGSNNKYSGRPAVASWSAGSSGSNSNSNSKVSAGRFGNHRPQSSSSSSFGRPSYYPDPQAGPNDPRWVLVSTTGETSVKNPPYKGHTAHLYDRDRDRDRNRYSDFPYEFNSHRHSKDINFTKLFAGSDPLAASILSQEELFRRTNETLNSLTPVLMNLHRQGELSTTEDSEPFRTFIPLLDDELVSNGEGSGLVESSRSTDKPEAQMSSVGATDKDGDRKSKSFLGRINPVFAAVGAGMIPATIAAVLPVALGRRRRKRHVHGYPHARESYGIAPRLVLTPRHRNSPTLLLSSSAPKMYKFLRKPAMKSIR